MISKEFFETLTEVANEKHVSEEAIIDAFAKGIVIAYKKEYGNTAVRVNIDPLKNQITAFSQTLVVETPVFTGPEEMPQISLADAKKIKRGYKIGDIVEQEIKPKEFGRIAAATAKQVFTQNLKNLEKEKAYNYFKSLEGEMVYGDVIEVTDRNYVFNIGQNTTTIIPVTDVLKNEKFNVGDKVRLYITRVEQGTRGAKIFVSRKDPSYVKRLFELYVPEIKDGTIEIRGIARDAGEKTKMAIFSNDPNVDAKGACIGENSYRIREVIKALGGEKIDLYYWSANPEELIAESLSPAHVVEVVNVDVKKKSAIAVVENDHLSLAIGNGGQNVRLAATSCGWKIDIKSYDTALNEGLLNSIDYGDEE